MKLKIGKPSYNHIYHIVDKKGHYLCGQESLLWLRLRKKREMREINLSEIDSYQICEKCKKTLHKVLSVLILP